MTLDWIARELHPRRPFRISRARRTAVMNVFVRLSGDGAVGYGEAAPNAFYEETWQGVGAALEAAQDYLSSLRLEDVAALEHIWSELWPLVQPSRAAQCAIDVALWDWLARRKAVSVSELAWGQPAQPVATFCTIGLSSPEELEEKIRELDGFPRIKIKSDAAASMELLRAVRSRSAALLAVDANCAWGEVNPAAILRPLQEHGIAFLEQPLPPGKETEAQMRAFDLPVLADESCVAEADVERVAESFDGFNIKLVKCGGFTPGRRMAAKGRALGLRTMVGCMLESSALIAAGAALAQQTDYADLDGAWLLADDPFEGWRFDRGILHPPGDAGSGALPLPGLFPS